MKYIFTILMLVSFNAYSGIVVVSPNNVTVNYQDCTRNSEQFDENFVVSNMTYTCPEDNSRVILTKSHMRIFNDLGNYYLRRCFIDELIHEVSNETWGMNVECSMSSKATKDLTQFQVDLKQQVFGWDNCSITSAQAFESVTPEAFSLHCEDPEPNNDDYYIILEDNYLNIDYGNTQESYYNCEVVYFTLKFNAGSPKADFKTVCWD